jgi:hypothetical protein
MKAIVVIYFVMLLVVLEAAESRRPTVFRRNRLPENFDEDLERRYENEVEKPIKRCKANGETCLSSKECCLPDFSICSTATSPKQCFN